MGAATAGWRLAEGGWWRCLRSLAALLLLGAGGEHGDELGGVDEAFVVDVHLVVGLVHLVGGELVAPGHEGVPAGE